MFDAGNALFNAMKDLSAVEAGQLIKKTTAT